MRIVLLVARRVVADPQLDHKPGRQGNVGAWRVEKGQIVRDASVVSRNGDETRTRAVVVVPSKDGGKVLTIGHAKNSAAMVGQLLEWKMPGSML